MLNFLWTLPDGKLHIVVCNVGQGDASYIRFPDGRDMVIDGGPNDSVLQCLGKYMPFWDRTIDIVVLSHPEKDHLNGVVSILNRYTVGTVVRSNVVNMSDGYKTFTKLMSDKHVSNRFLTTGSTIGLGLVHIRVLWPSLDQISIMSPSPGAKDVLGAQNAVQRNDGSVVLWVRYGSFDALFPGDADTHVESKYDAIVLADQTFEVLKVPHHGSRTGMSSAFLDWLKPKVAVISVGKNNYGHPAPEILQQLADRNIRVLRTDKDGDIEIVSDGKGWQVVP